ncbi:VanZ family protein [Candidatus Parcubacteria bacterium]|jgi:VanZ family protein|nr:VanZ family protein [Candidatus Parcubacteria bacterium]MBT7227995.1 VanZ family protein [Candidatus Parcubacteria bacterium]
MLHKRQLYQLLFLLAAALWGGLIFYLSSIPDLSSGLSSTYDFVLRKGAHVFVFMVLTYLIASSFDKKERYYLLFVIIAAVVYALIDELHQSFIVSRYGSARDVVIDSVGIYLGIWLYKFFPPDKMIKFLKK